ncbi:MAG: hypothetical protein ACYDAG_11180 [Chloroflexota bacterium]
MRQHRSLAAYVLWALATPVQFWSGWQFYKGAVSAARHLTTNMNTFIAVGTTAAYLFSAGEAARGRGRGP